MNFAVAKEDRAFYAMNGWVEFESLLEEKELEKINLEIDRILCERLKLSDRFLYRAQPEEIFLQGHDLWRESDILRDLCCKRAYAKIAADLFRVQQIRLGADQLFPGGWKSAAPDTILPGPTLLDNSSFQQVTGGLLFCLRGGYSLSREKNSSPITPYPSVAGNAIFFPGNIPINLSTELRDKQDRYLMVVYTPQKTLYVKREQDLQNHTLKYIGYTFGDHLDNERHPIILK